MVRYIICISTFCYVFCCGCIPVEEIDSKLWDNATIDPELAGDWKSDISSFPHSASYVSFTQNEDTYNFSMVSTEIWPLPHPEPEFYVRTYQIYDIKLLVFKDIQVSIREAAHKAASENEKFNSATPDETSTIREILTRLNNIIVRYEIIDDTLVYYQLKAGILKQLILEGRIKGQINSESDIAEARLFHLDRNGVSLLAKKELWTPYNTYHRIANIEEDINQTMIVNTQIKIDLKKMTEFVSDDKVNALFKILDSLPEWERTRKGGRIQYNLVEWPFEIKHPSGKLSGWDYDAAEKIMINDLSGEEEKLEMEKAQKSRFSMVSRLYYLNDCNDLEDYKEHYSVLIDPTSDHADLRLWRDDQGMHSSIFIGRGRLWLEIRETSWYDDRRKTLQFITYMNDLLGK